MELEQLPAKYADAIRVSMERNGSYHWRVIVLSFWSILLGITCLAVLRCLFQIVGLCDDDGLECFAGMVLWMSPIDTKVSWLLIMVLMAEIMCGSIVIHAIKRSNLGFSMFGSIWIGANAVLIGCYTWKYSDEVWWRYLVITVLCIFTSAFQLLFCKRLKVTISEYKANLRNVNNDNN